MDNRIVKLLIEITEILKDISNRLKICETKIANLEKTNDNKYSRYLSRIQ